MSNEQVNRNYHMTDSELTMFAQHVIDSMHNDIEHFAPFAILPATVTSFQTLCDAFELFPTDTYMNLQQQLATENKDKLLDEVRRLLKTMALRAEFAWGKNSPKYKNLGISDMSQLTDESFITRARLIYACINDYKTELVSQGITAEALEDFEAKIQELEDAKRQQIEKVSIREEKTIERIETGNNLYKLIKHYCNIGKGIWDGVNSAKYNDYIIYDTYIPTSLTAPENLVCDPETMIFSWSSVENSTSYILQESISGVEWNTIYSGADTSVHYVPSAPGLHIYKVIPRNSAGNGPASSTLHFNYVTAPATPQNLSYNNLTHVFSWDSVSGVNNYQVVCARDDAEPVWVSYYDGPETHALVEPGDGAFYVRVRCYNASGYSDWSELVFIGFMNSAPTNLIPHVTYSATTEVTLNFQKINGVPAYKLFLAYKPLGSSTINPAELIESVSATDSPILVPTTVANMRYFMALKCYNGYAYGIMSQIVSIDVNGLTS